MISVGPAKCETIDSAWEKVVAEPALPVKDGTDIKLGCPEDHTNKGSDKATCNDGQVVFTGDPPACKGENNFVISLFTA